MRRIYLDHAATTPAHPKVVKARLAYLVIISIMALALGYCFSMI